MEKLDKIILALAFAMIAVGGWCVIRTIFTAPATVLDVFMGIAIGMVLSGVIVCAINDDRKKRKRQKAIIEKVRAMFNEEDDE